MIYLALFLGSDYTLGIKGIGIVNAMEILNVFDNEEALKRFKDWARAPDNLLNDLYGHYSNISKKELNFKEFHKNYKKYWDIPKGFPNADVVNAYQEPNVDKSKEQFEW